MFCSSSLFCYTRVTLHKCEFRAKICVFCSVDDDDNCNLLRFVFVFSKAFDELLMFFGCDWQEMSFFAIIADDDTTWRGARASLSLN